MRKGLYISLLLVAIGCQSEEPIKKSKVKKDTSVELPMTLDLKGANRLSVLPLDCIDIEFPNKLGQVITAYNDLAAPSELHPAFYGCFDWHSAVHGHWSLVRLLKSFPEIGNADRMIEGLMFHLSEENIQGEIRYFENESNQSFERMYGWAWLLKLSQEINTWDSPEARQLEKNLAPLAALIANRVKEFLPKLHYAIRVGTHTNSAFAMSMIYDYAIDVGDTELTELITKRAKDYYAKDCDCPLTWEPSGYDFLSPCLEEANLMRRVLNEKEFKKWLEAFLPELIKTDFTLEPGIVSDREDGHLVHLDGLNYSRAWCLYGIAETLPEFQHLIKIANAHIKHSLPSLVDGNYEGGHWLASFALLALAR